MVKSSDAVIRGETARRKYASLLQNRKSDSQRSKHKHKRSASKDFDEQQKAIVQLQSGKLQLYCGVCCFTTATIL